MLRFDIPDIRTRMPSRRAGIIISIIDNIIVCSIISSVIIMGIIIITTTTS